MLLKASLSRMAGTCTLLVSVVLGCGSSDDSDAEDGAGGVVSSAPALAEDSVASTESLAAPAASEPGSADFGDLDLDSTLRLSFAGPTETLDPHRQTIGSATYYTSFLYDRLFQMNNDFEVEPMLATEWKFAPDGTSLELQLRSDVSFHDGTPFDADVVKANLERAKTVEGGTGQERLASISTVEVIDPTTVRINLVSGGADVPALLSTNLGMMISPTAFDDPSVDLALAPGDAGSGPYVVTEFKPSELGVFEPAADTYWDPEFPRQKRIEVSFIADTVARLNGLQAGQIDYAQITGPTVSQAAELVGVGGLKGHRVQTLGAYSTMLRGSRELLSDVRVRQAISHAIDKEGIAQGLLDGNCTATDQFYPETHWAHDPALDGMFDYSPERATTLLEEAGVTDLALELVVGAQSQYEPVAQAVQSQLGEVGVAVTVSAIPTSDALSEFRSGSRDMLQFIVASAVDPNQLLAENFIGGYALAGDSPELVADAATANDPTLSQEERAALYGELFQSLLNEAFVVPICYSGQILMSAENVVGVETAQGQFLGVIDPRSLHLGA